jgi:hypothetical protein
MLAMEKEFVDVTYAEMILTRQEIDERFKNDSWSKNFASVNNYKSHDTVFQQMKRAGANDLEQTRLYIDDTIWSAFYVHRALLGRLGTLYEFSSARGATGTGDRTH